MKMVYERVTDIWNSSTIGFPDSEDPGEHTERQRELMEADRREKAEQFQPTVIDDLWRGTSFQVNRFRRETLKLSSTSWEKLETGKVPFLYCFSLNVVPSPLDWMDWIHTVGYWFLDNPDQGWEAPQSLFEFIEKKDNRPLVYVGFCSIIVPDPDEMMRIIVESVRKQMCAPSSLRDGWHAFRINKSRTRASTWRRSR